MLRQPTGVITVAEPDYEPSHPSPLTTLMSYLMRPFAVREARRRLKANHKQTQRERTRTTGTTRSLRTSGGYVGALALLIGGIAAHIHFGSLSQACQFAESAGAGSDNQCALATSVEPVAIPLAVLGAIALAVLLFIDTVVRQNRLAEEPAAELDAYKPANVGTDDKLDFAGDDDFEPAADRYCVNTRCDDHGLEMEFPFCPACGHATARYE